MKLSNKPAKTVQIKREDPYFDPRCCTYKLSGKTRDYIDKLINDSDVDSDVKAKLNDIMDEDEANKDTLTYDSLVELHKYIQRADKNYTNPFYMFSDSCKCIKPQPRQNKQLEERLQLLRLKNSQAVYDQMACSVDKRIEDKIEKIIDGESNISFKSNKRRSSDKNLSTFNIYSNNNNINNNNGNNNQSRTSEFKRLNGSIMAVINSFLVFICTFIFCYKALEYSLPQPNIIAQTLFGIGGSTIVAIAELYFLIRVV